MKRSVLLVLVALAVGLVPVAASASPAVYQSGAVNLPIPDVSQVWSDMSVGTYGKVLDVNVAVDLTHTWVGDLQLVLTHLETGTSVIITDGVCGSGDDMAATFDDEAAGAPACSGTPTISGTVTPFELLSAFDGEGSYGTWRLTVYDHVGLDVGALYDWALYFDLEAYGNVIVQKAVSPSGAPAASFGFDASWSTSGFSLVSGGSADSGPVPAGLYSVAETAQMGWSLVSATCDDGSSPAAIGLSPGETVTCTFTNAYTAAAPVCFGLAATIVGTVGADVLTGTPDADVIAGLGGDDVISGLGGNDRICGGAGADDISGGAGNDRIRGGAGADTIFGTLGADRLHGGAGIDVADGGLGTDVCSAETETACE